MTRILITGGAGFVGSSLALGLHHPGQNIGVVVLDNLKRRGSEANIPRLQAAGIEFVQGDIRYPKDLEPIGKVDWLIECAAEPSVLMGHQESPIYAMESNLMGAIHCLEFARKCKARVIFASTSRVYPMDPLNEILLETAEKRFTYSTENKMPGLSAHGITESFPLEGKRTLYGASKLSAEMILEEYRHLYDLESVTNRCGVIAGPWQMGKVDQGVVVYWSASHFYRKNLKYMGYGGKGLQVRDVLHIEDFIELIELQMKHWDKVQGQTFNIGGGEYSNASLQELTHLCQERSGNQLNIGSDPETRYGDIPWYITDNRKVHEILAWKPKRDMNQIIEDIFVWLEQNSEMLKPFLIPE